MKYCDVSYLLCYHSHCHTGNYLLSRTPLMMDLKVKNQKEKQITKRTFLHFLAQRQILTPKGIRNEEKKKKKRRALKGIKKWRGHVWNFLSLKLWVGFCILRQMYLHKALTFRNNVVGSSVNSLPPMITTVLWCHRDESVLKHLLK